MIDRFGSQSSVSIYVRSKQAFWCFKLIQMSGLIR